MRNIDNQTALITGGSKGIGYGIAEAMLAKGMKVAITSRSLEAGPTSCKSTRSNELWPDIAYRS